MYTPLAADGGRSAGAKQSDRGGPWRALWWIACTIKSPYASIAKTMISSFVEKYRKNVRREAALERVFDLSRCRGAERQSAG